MNQNLTHLHLLLDRSGSMYPHKDAAEEGANRFIQKNRAAAGDCDITVVTFNHQIRRQVNPRRRIKLDPYGRTALYDAIGSTIHSAGAWISTMEEEDKPGLVIIAIITDGLENASQEYTLEQIQSMIKHQEEKYSWEFAYLGGFAAALESADQLGIHRASRFDPRNTDRAIDMVTNSSIRMRTARASGEQGMDVSAAGNFSEEEKKWMS